VSTLAEVAADARRVVATGSDPVALAAILAWVCGPRRSPDALRRRLRDSRATDGPTGRRLAGDTADRLARMARDDGGLDGPLAAVARRVLARWSARGVRVTIVGDVAYPARLAEGWPDLDAPILLAWRGEPPVVAGPGVAIVGARRATGYGTAVAGLLATAVARAGGRVISGGAVGIDAAAHTAALGLPGGTTVVLGCGHDVAYPAPHARSGGLFDRVLDDGGTLLSELLPEVVAHPGVIRARNRIVAGLAEVTVVVEGGARSGALLTAGAAAERGREVLAVPGDITAPGSAAPLRLLAEGVRAFTGPADVLDLLSVRRPVDPDLRADLVVADVPDATTATGLPVPIRRALEHAGWRGMLVEDLALMHSGGAGALLAALTRARLSGVVEDVDGGVRLRGVRPPGPPRPSDR